MEDLHNSKSHDSAEEFKQGTSSSEENENQDSLSSSNDLLDAQQELNLSDDNLSKLQKILQENVSKYLTQPKSDCVRIIVFCAIILTPVNFCCRICP